ncbi:MFS general substrate transporter [Armillaria luteobubalina]|uniref:MFS general substrate transporter n=1 Tax=Armillaria luteobubalina TaxID=153913 RepID=A0AA39QGB0_9AGAR|nr:MFS general substrate transporter [Armillaria luteobubalina]
MSETLHNTGPVKVHWYRSTFFNATILGITNFLAPGIWGAMNSLGAGGLQKPYLVNASNALTFALMVITAFFGSWMVNRFGIRATLSFGAAGYAPYAAGLYCNNVYGTQWFVLVGAALCGISAGTFWMAEGAVALNYPEANNLGKFIGYWLSYRVGGQIVGGAINLGLNANRSEAGSVSPKVYVIFITLQALAPFTALLISPPEKVQRTDGTPVHLIKGSNLKRETKDSLRLFFSKNFLLIIPLITQAVFSEAFNGTYLTLHFSVRARALGSFLSAIVAIIFGNILGRFLDRTTLPLKFRARTAYIVVLGLQGCWWIWSTIIQHEYQKSGVVLDWLSPGFGRGFALYLFLVGGFQLNYMLLFWVVGHVVEDVEGASRVAGLLRATESAAQCVSYGLNSVSSLATLPTSSINFGLWGVSLVPAWLVIRQIGVNLEGRLEREARLAEQTAEDTDTKLSADALE